MLMGVIDKGFLTRRHSGETHRRSLQAEGAAKLYTDQLRLRIPRVRERLFAPDVRGTEYKPFCICHKLFPFLFRVIVNENTRAR
jgi:hypothetical protein